MISIGRPVNRFAERTAVRHCHADVIVVESAGRHMYIDFKGKAAHAGMYPWKGRSALGAVEIFHRSSHGCGFTHILGLIGIMATLFVIVAIVSAFIVSLKQPWTKIVVRVAGSWVAAMGMLMFGWLMRGQG